MGIFKTLQEIADETPQHAVRVEDRYYRQPESIPNHEKQPPFVMDGRIHYWLPGTQNRYSGTWCGQVWSHVRHMPSRIGTSNPHHGGREWVSIDGVSTQTARVILCAVEQVDLTTLTRNDQAMHLDNDVTNNDFRNLQFGSQSMNRRGIIPQSQRSFTTAEEIEIYNRVKSGETCTALGKEYGVRFQTISTIYYKVKNEYAAQYDTDGNLIDPWGVLGNADTEDLSE